MNKNKVIEILKAVATHAITSELNPDELDMEGFEEFATRIDAEYSGGVSEKSIADKGAIDRKVDKMLAAFKEHTDLTFTYNPSKGFDHTNEIRKTGRKFRELRMELDELLYNFPTHEISNEDLLEWPCQQLLGGAGAAIYSNVDGMCKHPECHPCNNDKIKNVIQGEIEKIITDHQYGDGVDAKSAAKKITGKWGMGVHGREVWHINEDDPRILQPDQSDREIAMKWWNSLSIDNKMDFASKYYPGQSHNLLTASEIAKMFKSRESESMREEKMDSLYETWAIDYFLQKYRKEEPENVTTIAKDAFRAALQLNLHPTHESAHITEGEIEQLPEFDG